MTKNILRIIGITSLLFLALLSGCQKTNTLKTKEYDLAVIDSKNITTFKKKDEQLIKVEQLKRTDGNLNFWRNNFWEMDNNYYTKTSESPKLEVFLAKIDNDLSIDLVKAEGNDAYTSNVDGEFFYTTACFSDRTEFYKYDKNLKLKLKKEIIKKESILTNQLIPLGDYLYVLCGYSNTDDGTSKNMLLKMTKDFEVLEEINLGDETSSYMRMVQFQNKLYITEGNAGMRVDGEPGESNRVLVYDLATKNKEYLTLTYPYPMEIYVDTQNENLIIRHYELYVKSYTWTVYNLKNQTESFIHFPEYEKLEKEKHINAPFFTQKNGYYYFMFDDQISTFDPKVNKSTKLDLSSYNFEDTTALIINK
ncbi:hypothetical protein ACWOC1_09300 [Enterococcus quebecensis]|uniref:DUF5050 domain-containing protein n=1 Tax=Enterococcus quebecensis TaxID=903983 RepID=A0A1E5GSH4_9ENTE|nr:hypothetical protein [Enterococcus quebecensis]OEG15651.1 hypothetical protein BCR23_09305 [Enterococcus quebecensis]OJG74562.1 hypothetical protein RV12_GL002317 [Enterococcus quebecensis]